METPEVVTAHPLPVFVFLPGYEFLNSKVNANRLVAKCIFIYGPSKLGGKPEKWGFRLILSIACDY